MTLVDPHSVTDISQGEIRSLTIDLNVDFGKRVLHGRARYRLDRARKGPLDLDTRGLTIASIAGSRGPLPYHLDDENPILGQRLRIQRAAADGEIEIAFTTSAASRALQWLTPAQTAGGVQPYLFTQCQPIHARTVFPCQDSPSVRFTYQAALHVPAPLTAVMAAAAIRNESSNGRRTFHFRMDQPIPSYLFAFAVGDLVSREIGPRSRVYAEPTVAEAAAWEFDRTEAMLVEAERLFGPYAWERYDMLVLPPSFPYGGMENPRLTFLTPTMIVGDRSLTNLIAHELAHSWTGNLVTNATWEDFWLNEGWTTYAERRILGALEGEEHAMLAAATGRNTLWQSLALFGYNSNPSRLKFSQRGIDPESVVSYIAYEKGYAFLIRLERAVGRKAFETFALGYIRRHRFHSITTAAFLEELRRELPQAARQVDLHAWIYEPGLPADAPEFESPLIDAVSDRLFDFQEGRLPRRAEVASWSTEQTYLFLQFLPRVIPPAHCRDVEKAFDLTRTRVPYFLAHFFEIGIRSGYRPVLPRAEELISRVGRLVIILPVFRAMAEAEWTRARARPLFERVRQRHHPITALAMEGVLRQHGL